MTAEPRPVEEIREIAERYLYDGDNDRPLNDGYLRLAHVADRLAAADRENAELRGEVERLTRRLFPGQGESYANEVERQRVVIDQMATIAKTVTVERDDLRAQLAAAQAQLAEAQEHADMRDKVIREWERVHWRDVDRMTAAIKAAEDGTRRIPSPFADNVARAVRAALSAAPQPEPDECPACRRDRTKADVTCHRTPADGWVCERALTPPASDEPARKMTTASEIREQDAWIRGERDEPARTPDLMAALRVSVEAAKKRRIAPKDES